LGQLFILGFWRLIFGFELRKLLLALGLWLLPCKLVNRLETPLVVMVRQTRFQHFFNADFADIVNPKFQLEFRHHFLLVFFCELFRVDPALLHHQVCAFELVRRVQGKSENIVIVEQALFEL